MAGNYDLGTAEGRIEIDTTGLKSAEAATKSFEKTMASSMAATANAMSSFGRKMTLGVTLPVVGALGLAVKAFSEAEKAAAQTEAVIESTGGKANVAADEVVSLANSIRDYSSVSDEAIQQGANMLLTFTNIRNEVGEGNDVFNQAVEILTDLSVATGRDMVTSAVQLGKALNDPVRGMTALRRVGVVFTSEQEQMIRTMMENNDVMGAQKVILAELNTEFGRSAEELGQTEYGKLQIALGQLGDTLEELGALVAPVLAGIASGLKAVVEWISKLPAPVKAVLGVFVGLLAVLGPLTWMIGGFLKIGLALLKLWGAMRIAMAAATGQMLVTTQATLALSAAQASAAVGAGSMLASLAKFGPYAAVIAGIGLAIYYTLNATKRAKAEMAKFGQALVKAAVDGKRAINELSAELLVAVEEVAGGEAAIESFRMANQGLAHEVRSGNLSIREAVVQYTDLINKARESGGAYAEWANEVTNGATATEYATARTQALAIEMFNAGQMTRNELINALVVLGVSYEDATRQADGLDAALRRNERSVVATGERIRTFARMTVKEFEDWKAGVVANLNATTPALDRLAGRARITTDSIVNSFRRQQREFEHYAKNLADFSTLNIPSELKQQIIDMGVEGSTIMQQFSNLSKRELAKVRESFKSGQDAIAATEDPLAQLNQEAENAANQGLTDLSTKLDYLKNHYSDLQLHVHTTYTHSGKPPGDEDGMASGGVSSGGMTIVGEKGPELLFLPRGAGVLPSYETLRLLQKLSSGLGGMPMQGGDGYSAEPLSVSIEVDGVTLTKIVELHSRSNRIKMGRRV
jgi:hypothetical protein